MDDLCFRLHYQLDIDQLPERFNGEVDCICPNCGRFVRMKADLRQPGGNALTKHLKIQRMWQSTQTLAWVFATLVAVWLITQWLWIILAMLVICIFAKSETFSSGEPKMRTFIMSITGLKHINMKLAALAEYLKVKFTYVPEHYRCEPNE